MIFDLYLSTRTERNPQVTKRAKVRNCRKQRSFQDLFVIINLWRERQRQPMASTFTSLLPSLLSCRKVSNITLQIKLKEVILV